MAKAGGKVMISFINTFLKITDRLSMNCTIFSRVVRTSGGQTEEYTKKYSSGEEPIMRKNCVLRKYHFLNLVSVALEISSKNRGFVFLTSIKKAERLSLKA